MSDQVDADTGYERCRLIETQQERYGTATNDNSQTATKWLPRDVIVCIFGVVLVLLILFNTGVSMSQLTVGRQVR